MMCCMNFIYCKLYKMCKQLLEKNQKKKRYPYNIQKIIFDQQDKRYTLRGMSEGKILSNLRMMLVILRKAAEDALEANQKQKPSFELSGKLAAETNRFREVLYDTCSVSYQDLFQVLNEIHRAFKYCWLMFDLAIVCESITLLFNEPPDARKPDIRWRLYVFKGGDFLNEPLYIHRQSCYLFGRERRVADIPTDHPSCSKQHAVIQFRQVEEELPDGTTLKQVKPYIMDLGSTNKTYVNDNPIEPQRYYELLEKDTIKFGNSRYVGFYTASVFDFMHAGSSILMLLYANTGETQSFPP
ncbi:hypothetical protein Tsubulata_026847 [Turnera subulata]|uniref:FHA domain-containing protein n=1 Tax=Turnera subulata TaxID=218843 RepID=A0A9Q0EZG6_9ROSI|nr:hypothetical protein Tsubulata_026847 [Turnera subulata]